MMFDGHCMGLMQSKDFMNSVGKTLAQVSTEPRQDVHMNMDDEEEEKEEERKFASS